MDWAAREQLVLAVRAAVQGDGDGDFFNRKKELQALLSRLATRPVCVTVVIGPNDCGKTKLLQALERLWCANVELAAMSPVFYFDMRQEDWNTPKAAAGVVARKFQSWTSVFNRWVTKVKEGLASVTIKKVGGGVGADIARKAVASLLPVCDQAETSGLTKVMESFCEVVSSTKVRPVFILDEVDRLKTWEKVDFNTFTGFFKSMVKQDNKAYLILSSSDDLFQVWLREMFTTSQWEPFGVGCFPEPEARRFFIGHSMALAVAGFEARPTNLQDSDWNDIYAVCGGSPMLLNQCARTAGLNGISWQQAADSLMRNCISTVETGLAATPDTKNFSGDKYEKICRRIVQDGFVGSKAVLKEIYNEDKAVWRSELGAMLSQNYIHMRYVTAATLYGDVSISDAGREVDLVMARSPAERAAMKEVLEL